MLAIGCDHGGYKLKEEIVSHLKANNVEFKDFGVFEEKSVDYPDIASAVCKSILSGECENGVLVCGTGIGISIAANKVSTSLLLVFTIECSRLSCIFAYVL